MTDMRKLIRLVETHEPEFFNYLFGNVQFSVGLARDLIDSGEIKAVPYDMPVQKAGRMLLNLHDYEFDAEGNRTSFPVLGTYFSFDRMKQIPDERMAEPALMVMWNPHVLNPKAPDQAYPILIDGNHRLARRYFAKEEGTMPCLVVRDMADVMKFTTVRDTGFV